MATWWRCPSPTLRTQARHSRGRACADPAGQNVTVGCSREWWQEVSLLEQPLKNLPDDVKESPNSVRWQRRASDDSHERAAEHQHEILSAYPFGGGLQCGEAPLNRPELLRGEVVLRGELRLNVVQPLSDAPPFIGCKRRVRSLQATNGAAERLAFGGKLCPQVRLRRFA